ncbi:hypothetical protein GCM10009601_09070 [Streptomyces thermospinosisporus]|uniref:Uncharacterized protein n=1 Tax=Streptomyces thermospinosisporus TaxID=161482 RepID=A0ABP4J9H3_9ACTN
MGAVSPTRSQGAAKARGRPAITAISSTGWSGESRYTAPEWACTSSIIEASVKESSGRPTGARTLAGACADDCSDTPTTSSHGRAPGFGPICSLRPRPARRAARAGPFPAAPVTVSSVYPRPCRYAASAHLPSRNVPICGTWSARPPF